MFIHKYGKYNKCLIMMILTCIKQHLSNICSSTHEKLSSTEAKLKKSVACIKKRISVDWFLYDIVLRRERVKQSTSVRFLLNWINKTWMNTMNKWIHKNSCLEFFFKKSSEKDAYKRIFSKQPLRLFQNIYTTILCIEVTEAVSRKYSIKKWFSV